MTANRLSVDAPTATKIEGVGSSTKYAKICTVMAKTVDHAIKLPDFSLT